MVDVRQLVEYCDRRLEAARFDDYCPNGLQVDAGEPVSRICTGVTASLALVEQAAAAGAQALLVHHGYFWRGEPAPLTGMKGRRIRALFAHGLSLIAYHLPLDAHPTSATTAGSAPVSTSTRPVRSRALMACSGGGASRFRYPPGSGARPSPGRSAGRRSTCRAGRR